jgi:dihydroneopterin aldolase
VKTLDYDALHDRIVRIVSTTSYALLEALGGELIDAIFDDDRVVRATVTLSKPQILAGATPSVTLTRDRVHRNR